MIKALQLTQGSQGLDAGCGIGLQALLLCSEVGPTGHVTALDASADMLDYGRAMVNRAGLSAQISHREGDLTKLPFADDAFDWVWSCDCVGYILMEPIPLLQELVRVVKPGGLVAVAAWSSERLLPGYPRLEARLAATLQGMAPFDHGERQDRHFLRALGWFRELGLEESRGQVFADSVHAPLSAPIHDALEALFAARWPDPAAELTPGDLAEFQRLCLPGSPDFILGLPDYYALFTYTMFWGRRPVSGPG